MSTKVIEVKKVPTWIDHLSDMEVDQELLADHDKAAYLRTLISSHIAFRFPERKYETEKVTVKGKDFIKIKRIA